MKDRWPWTQDGALATLEADIRAFDDEEDEDFEEEDWEEDDDWEDDDDWDEDEEDDEEWEEDEEEEEWDEWAGRGGDGEPRRRGGAHELG